MFKKIAIIVLALFCKGYMGQVHPREVSLANITDWADCILLVQKTEPYQKTKLIEIDESKRFPAYESHRRIFKVIQVLKNESEYKFKSKQIIEVRPAYDELMLNLERMNYLEGRSKSPILNFYGNRNSESENLERSIIFLSYRKEEEGFSFCVDGAMEMESKLNDVLNLIKNSTKPKHNSEPPEP